MNVNQIKQSNFLTKHDVGKGTLVTIKGDVFQQNVAKEGAPEEHKYCIAFDELEKPMVLNSTNAQLIAQITGSQESENWNGHKLVLYEDPSISFGGKLVGGIRVRAPRQPTTRPVPSGIRPPAPKPVPRPEPEPELESLPDGGDPEVPF
jgi:hypothetical protein